jgi:hypothetical protein
MAKRAPNPSRRFGRAEVRDQRFAIVELIINLKTAIAPQGAWREI